MRAELELMASREGFSLRCRASYGPGVHLVSGAIGSGKTTMALAMAGLVPFDGDLRFEGVESKVMSLQFPEYHVTAASVDDEVRSWGLDPGEVLPRAGLIGRNAVDPFKLSRGQLKRLNLACVFALDPDLLILDEPFSSLDCRAKAKVCQAIGSRDGRITMLFSHERAMLPRVTTLSQISDAELEPLGAVPGSIGRWAGAPPYLRRALEHGARPRNIAMDDVEEALCATRG